MFEGFFMIWCHKLISASIIIKDIAKYLKSNLNLYGESIMNSSFIINSFNTFSKHLQQRIKVKTVNNNNNKDKEIVHKILDNSFSEYLNSAPAQISLDSFHYYKNKIKDITKTNKQSEMELMLIEGLASTNYSHEKNLSVLSKNIMKSIQWEGYQAEPFLQNSNCIIDSYVRYSGESSMEKKIEKLKEINILKNTEIQKENTLFHNHYEIGIIKQFINEEEILKISITKQMNENFYKIYSQGTPEKIKKICKIESLPINYDEKINQYKREGKIILCLGYKALKTNYLGAQKLTKEKCIEKMNFLGCIVLNRNYYDHTNS